MNNQLRELFLCIKGHATSILTRGRLLNYYLRLERINDSRRDADWATMSCDHRKKTPDGEREKIHAGFSHCGSRCGSCYMELCFVCATSAYCHARWFAGDAHIAGGKHYVVHPV